MMPSATRRSRWAGAVIIAALATTACGGGADEDTTVSSTSTTTDASSTSAPTTTVESTTTTLDPRAPSVHRHGQLAVCGTQLCDEVGRVVQLRGMSTHGLQWYRQCVTDSSLDVLFDDWHADLLRVSMYVQEGGYVTDPERFDAEVREVVDDVVDRDRYVIIDWHVLSPGDPMVDVDAAVEFFTGMAQRYSEDPNVIYEIANEPNGVSWPRIKEYADRVIPAIRAHDPDAIILVGTPGWSSFGVSEGGDPEDVAALPIADPNVMYTYHHYAASFGQEYLDALARASSLLPVFVSEFGTQQNTGEGADDFAAAQRFVDLLATEQISWVVWNYSDDERSGAAWTPDTCDDDGPWTPDRLKPAGAWARDQLLAGR